MAGTARASGQRGNTQRDGSAAQTSKRAAEAAAEKAAEKELRSMECAEKH